MLKKEKLKKVVLALFFTGYFFSGISKAAPFDPPRAGGPIVGLEPRFLTYFNDAIERFQDITSVTGIEPGAPDAGLGPRFNMNSCAGCHAFPAVGGTSPALNPQVAVATRFGAVNTIPSFITSSGPIREVRFKKNPDGTPDGSVHQLYVITGRQDADGCNILQPDFASQTQAGNVIFRIPTPLFGLGLVSLIPDSAILQNMAANLPTKQQLGITGRPNYNGNDHTISRFGWKAQNKSIEIFSGEAYNVEMGVTNMLFGDENDQTPGCSLNSLPEDHLNYGQTNALPAMNDAVQFSNFARFLAPPTPLPPTSQTTNGFNKFKQVNCHLCHTPSFTTVPKAFAGSMSNQTVNLYSDLLIHNMGTNLADGVSQGSAGPDEFRTAPLWGIGQRLFFLHDGRTSDLNAAIQAHSSSGSEANAVITAYNSLSASDRNDVIAFLQSL